MMKTHRWAATLVLAAGLGTTALVAPSVTASASSAPRVLLVGSFHGKRGQFSSIQSAVNAAKPGDWILIGPGDYHETNDESAAAAGVYAPSTYNLDHGDYGGVLISTPNLHLRGMNRNSVIVDGTKAGAPQPCDNAAQWQDFGPAPGGTGAGAPRGRNGIVVWEANNVSIDNLTVCNYLGGKGDSGNEIWWNGGEGTGRVGLHGYKGTYLTATSTFFGPDGTVADAEQTAATYGIFSSSSSGGLWNQIYASNFNDSGMYIGGCRQVCDAVVDHAWMEYNALGYSGTNSGGPLVIEHSQFDNNKDGLDTNTQIDADPPAPQNGACPNGKTSPITHTHSCWVAIDNSFVNNNNPNVPQAGSASNGPTGTGMTLSGGKNDTVMDNHFSNNGAWGILFVPYPDENPPILGQSCSKTGGTEVTGFGCVYDPQGDALVHNTFTNDGFFGNPTNVDFGELTLEAHELQNCFQHNAAPQGSVPTNLESAQAKCGTITKAPNTNATLLAQVLCDTGFGACAASDHYPSFTGVVMHPLPKLATMPNPCAGVPANAWCKAGKPV